MLDKITFIDMSVNYFVFYFRKKVFKNYCPIGIFS